MISFHKLKTYAAIVVVTSATMTSCVVSKKKFDELNAKKSALEVERADCENELAAAIAERERLSSLSNELNSKCQKLIEDTTKTGDEYRKLRSDYLDLRDTYDNLIQSHDKLRVFSTAEKERLSKDLAGREKELAEAEKKNMALTQDLKDRETRVKELEKILADKEKAVNDLRNKVSNALLSFKEKDLTVYVKNGKVYVSLSEQLLFKSGSTAVDEKGVEALKKLAGVLKDQNEVNVMVEGHTDDVPVARGTSGIKDNWDLSVLRATEISRILIANGVGPQKIMPAGRGEFTPVAEGKTKEARQQNRRTEIILTPKLDELFKILEN